jgi:hypothetical protein
MSAAIATRSGGCAVRTIAGSFSISMPWKRASIGSMAALKIIIWRSGWILFLSARGGGDGD